MFDLLQRHIRVHRGGHDNEVYGLMLLMMSKHGREGSDDTHLQKKVHICRKKLDLHYKFVDNKECMKVCVRVRAHVSSFDDNTLVVGR